MVRFPTDRSVTGDDMQAYVESVKLLGFHFAKAILIALCVMGLLLCSLALVEYFAGVTPYAYLTTAMGLGMSVPVTVILTLILVAVCSLIPQANTINQLKIHHREFHMRTEDVARAYWMMHAQDRKGNFRLKNDFDAVRERMEFAMEHPELSQMETPTLTVAAQMSVVSRDLADIYSDQNVEQAQAHIAQRYDEIERLEGRIEVAERLRTQLRQATNDLDMREDIAQSRLSRFLEESLPLAEQLGYELRPAAQKVVPIRETE